MGRSIGKHAVYVNEYTYKEIEMIQEYGTSGSLPDTIAKLTSTVAHMMMGAMLYGISMSSASYLKE